MKTTIEVNTKREGDEIRAGLADPTVRAFVKVAGTLAALPNDRARRRVLQWIADASEEQALAEKAQRDAEPTA